jgi:tetratricopeptide (TPR) repeat protein
MWAAAIGFIIVCALAGVFYRMQSARAELNATTELARALKAEEPADRVAALAPLTDKKSAVTAEALYLRGEIAIEANDFDAAKASFEKLRAEYPEFSFTPDAVEGLGFLAEENEDYDAAIQHYQDLTASWPESYAARRQPFNIARTQERAGRIEDAIASYRDQLEVFPGSNIASRAQQALDRLRADHPDLFEGLPGEADAGVVESLEQSLFETVTPDAPEADAAEAPLPAPTEGEPTPGEAAPEVEEDGAEPSEPASEESASPTPDPQP